MSDKRIHRPVAICGYSYRLPGGLLDDEAFWKLMSERGFVQECVGDRYGKSEIPFDPNVVESPDRLASPYEGLIRDGKELEFDCGLFGMAVAEAKRMDPQIKMLLSCTWEALQCAGMDQKALHNSNTGVFIGQQISAAMSWRAPWGVESSDIPGKSMAMTANRISYHFNWMGPSYTVATACSSGITALDNAVKALNCGECNVATFGASQYLGFLGASIGFNSLGIISNTGSSRSFDKDANGYMRSEGCFMYVLKRLEDAKRDGDPIFGVVRGCRLNAAGAEPSAQPLTSGRMILAPCGRAQEVLMKATAAQCGVDPMTVDYVEAHATGTVVGDSVEGSAIAEAYGSSERREPLRLASARSNLGHMEAASFTLSLLKVIMMFQKRHFLPVSSHFKEPNPNIPLEEKRLRVQTETEPFPDRQEPVLVGINSFGFGGANGHCIIEEYKDNRIFPGLSDELPDKVLMFPFSAKSEDALVENVRRFHDKLHDLGAELSLVDLAANLSIRMTAFRCRAAFAAATMDELKAKLKLFIDGDKVKLSEAGEIETVKDVSLQDMVMVFPGQGSQWAGCGKHLYKSEPAFRQIVDQIDSFWVNLSGTKLSDVAFDEGVGDIIHECKWAQPVTFLVQVGLYELLRVYKVLPKAVVGHSAGEVAAAYASGAYTLEEACHIVYHRSGFQEKLAGCGRMLVLLMGKEDVERFIVEHGFTEGNPDGRIYIACFNAPENTVVCGTENAIESFQERLSEFKIKGKLIPGNIAFHSPLMEPIEQEIRDSLGILDQVNVKRVTTIPYISTVSGCVCEDFDADYWWNNVRQPVKYLQAMETVHKSFKPSFIMEISPHITLRSPTRDFYNSIREPSPTYIYSLIRNQDSAVCFAEWQGRCFKAGFSLNFAEVYALPKPGTHLFPKYAMKEQVVMDRWIDSRSFIPEGKFHAGPMVGFANNTICGIYVEMVLEAFKGLPIKFISARFLTPFVLSNEVNFLNTSVKAVQHRANIFEFRITSQKDLVDLDAFTLHCNGLVQKLSPDSSSSEIPSSVPRHLCQSDFDCFSKVLFKGEEFYETIHSRHEGFHYGPLFQGIKLLAKDENADRILAKISIDVDRWETSEKMGFVLHPTLLDGALQMFIFPFAEVPDFTGVPQMMQHFSVIKKPTSGQICCIWNPPFGEGLFEKGQFMGVGLGERGVGQVSMYDTATGDLIAYLGDYNTFNSNIRAGDMRKLNHSLSWQPKDSLKLPPAMLLRASHICEEHTSAAMKFLMQEMTEKLHPESGTPFFLNTGECVVGETPGSLLVNECVDFLTAKPIQFTVISSDEEFLNLVYENTGASSVEGQLRFASTADESFLDSGMLRPNMFELLVVRCAQDDLTLEQEAYLSEIGKLVAPGGLMMLETPASSDFCPHGFSPLWNDPVNRVYSCEEENASEGKDEEKKESTKFIVSKIVLLQAPSLETIQQAILHVPHAEDTSYIIDDSKGFSSHWRDMVTCAPRTQGSECGTDLFANARRWEHVYYFAMNDGGSLYQEAAELTDWIKSFSLQRIEKKGVSNCIFTVFTTGGARAVTSPTQSGVWGAVRSISMELADAAKVDFRLIDLADPADLRFVQSALRTREREICIHNGHVWSSRLIPYKNYELTVPMGRNDEQAYHLHTNFSGVLSDLKYRTQTLPDLQENHVEISLEAAALNFRDIMVALGRLPLQSYERSALGRNLGMECCGVVTHVHPSVSTVKVGDKVIAMKSGCFANKVHIHESAAFQLPENLSFVEGASVSSVYVTAYYSLVYLGRMRKGQSVLVHSAMGGVGQAAIALAKWKGAHVYATAGTPAKREALKKMGCKGVFHSRNTGWYQALMNATSEKGVDLCLNSLAGEHVDLCLEALKPGGAHFGIGKVDIYADRPLNMAVFRKNLTFRGVDIDRLMMDDPELVHDLTSTVLDLLGTKVVPTIPVTTYPFQKIHDALTFMMKGEHQGKIVLVPPSKGDTVPVVDFRPIFGKSHFGQDRTVVVTGGFGGFGMLMLRYLISMGSRNILMLDRDKELRRGAAWLLKNADADALCGQKTSPLRFETVYADVSEYEDVRNAIAEVTKRNMPPIGAVFHAAGVLDDRLIHDLDDTAFKNVYGPKADGAWNLHLATTDCNELEHFVMISSVSSVMGNPGQINYSAANSFLDGLAAMRSSQGAPALSFCLGAVSNAGMAARKPALLHAMKANGTPAISGSFAINALDYAIRKKASHNHLAALTTSSFPAILSSSDFLRMCAQLVPNSSAFKLRRGGVLSKVGITNLLAAKVADLCGVDSVDPNEPFSTYGLNSISVAQLVTFINVEMSYSGVGAIELMTSASCDTIAEKIVLSHQQQDEKEAQEEAEACENELEIPVLT